MAEPVHQPAELFPAGLMLAGHPRASAMKLSCLPQPWSQEDDKRPGRDARLSPDPVSYSRAASWDPMDNVLQIN